MSGKVVAPSIELNAFSCLYCGTLTTHFWYALGASARKDNSAPGAWSPVGAKEFAATARRKAKEQREEADESLISFIEELANGEIFILGESNAWDPPVHNLHVSKCYACKRIAVWVYNRTVWPPTNSVAEPNEDLPPDVLTDFVEASSIAVASPRGAAALLRLCVQKLCNHIGATAGTIDASIAQLVARGLDRRVEQALDIVRVIGNEAVHPGQMDLKDDQATAQELFRLVNLIAEIMITQPKHIEEMYGTLPAEKREAIEKRNLKAIGAPKTDST